MVAASDVYTAPQVPEYEKELADGGWADEETGTELLTPFQCSADELILDS